MKKKWAAGFLPAACTVPPQAITIQTLGKKNIPIQRGDYLHREEYLVLGRRPPLASIEKKRVARDSKKNREAT